MIKDLLMVSIGGVFGACFRYVISLNANNFMGGVFPLGTLLVNSLGGLMAGAILGLSGCVWYTKNFHLLVLVGFLGAFTTFSAYNIETINLFFQGKIKLGLFNILLNNILALLFVELGFLLTRFLFLKVDWYK
jgi:CrcB protein